MESGGGAGAGGRYEEKSGGKQVASFFSESTDNENLKAIYGNYNLWSWLRYWWLDTENYVAFMLFDKGYYDYDYERPSKRTEAAMEAPKNDAELMERLSKMGFGKKKDRLTPEELQAEVMRDDPT